MTTRELWIYFWKKKVAYTKPLDRYFIWVKPEDFLTVKNLFKPEYNIFHPKNSYRSSAFFRHIHAVDEGNLICIHHDHGNWTKFYPLIIIHFLIDVLPYFVFAWLRGIKLKDLTRPNL